MSNRDEYVTMVQDCINRESKLSDWERNFIDSIERQLANGGSLSDKQADILDNIWEKVT